MSENQGTLQLNSKSETNFEKVCDFNQTFGCVNHTKPKLDIFDTDKKTVDLRMKLIEEEVEELREAVANKDMKETIDALSDILYVVYGMGSAIGVDLDECFDLVHKSNMSKACKTEEEANQTVKWYQDNAEAFNKKNPSQAPVDPQIKFLNSKYIVYNNLTGKVLKSVYYNAVDFSDYLNNNAN